MTSLKITDKDIPSLEGKTAIVTGGASGIGLATAKILNQKGADVFILDLTHPGDEMPFGAHFIKCDTTSWGDLSRAYKQVRHVDIVIANAGISEAHDYLEDKFDDSGELLEPLYKIMDINFRGVLNTVKLALHYMRRQDKGGSIVITASSTAYVAEQSLPLYSSIKAGLIGLVRALRSTVPRDDISINAVAPAATITKLLPQSRADPLINAKVPVSSAHVVGLAVVYSAVASQEERVDAYGKDTASTGAGKWNGRTILILGENYTELEREISNLKNKWFGEKNLELTRKQQKVTDSREFPVVPRNHEAGASSTKSGWH